MVLVHMASEFVWVLTIEHKYGFNTWAFQTAEGARRRLESWVTDYWEEEFKDIELPADINDAVQYYFEWHESEWYLLDKVTVEE